MLNPLNPFCFDSLGLDPGWLDHGSGGFLIYAGQDSVGEINWEAPIGFVQAQGQPAVLSLPLDSRSRFCLAARAVSPAGVEETSCSATLWLDVDPSGSVAPAIAPVTDLVAGPLGDGHVLVNFTCSDIAGMLRPDTFDILGNSSTSLGEPDAGQLDLTNPIATIDHFPAGQQQFECMVPVAALPATFAIRPRASGIAGPISGLVVVYGLEVPIPQLLPT